MLPRRARHSIRKRLFQTVKKALPSNEKAFLITRNAPFRHIINTVPQTDKARSS